MRKRLRLTGGSGRETAGVSPGVSFEAARRSGVAGRGLSSSQRASGGIHRALSCCSGDYPDRSGPSRHGQDASRACHSTGHSPGARAERGSVLYTADRRALESDQIFMEFLTEEHDAFVIEDADHILASRANGNLDMIVFWRLPTASCGRKAERFSLQRICPTWATLMVASCFDRGAALRNARTRALSRAEAASLLRRICGGENGLFDCVMGSLLRTGTSPVTLAAIYQCLPADLRR